jgi:hypothetical protein
MRTAICPLIPIGRVQGGTVADLPNRGMRETRRSGCSAFRPVFSDSTDGPLHCVDIVFAHMENHLGINLKVVMADNISYFKIFQALGVKIMLAAPTGRAAKRMSETTGYEARTIHRLLEFSPKKGSFQNNEQTPLNAPYPLEQ